MFSRICRLRAPTSSCLRQFSASSERCLPAQIIDGKKIADDVLKEIKAETDEWIAQGNRPPQLSVVLVGEDPASSVYVKNKARAASRAGITSTTIRKPDTISQKELLAIVDDLNQDPNVDGILVQLPVPPHMDERTICDSVIPEKDVDGFNMVNIGRLCLDLPSVIPATPYGIWELIKRSGIDLFGKNAVVCGRSKNVGMPIATLMNADGAHASGMGLDATVTLCHRYTPPEQLNRFVKTADIIVIAVGIPNLIRGDMVKDGVAVIDVGINRVKDEETGKFKLVGDVNYEEVSQKASYITPVPGGVGPMTVAMLMKNTMEAAKRNIERQAQAASASS
ncbi:bifunctional methylenetetrahydrofolate dehydrogenase/cyclohydrolase, mitochondrial-like [Lytechinus variegatus]|uniref:bifunctional methylenetetrahydrofolate dehydrogenase/cyclohydrolase, mitochondrial-like n=1 Tax=Lytechinus variegatus TaxID=7654 RepID=UPI001BB1D47C|nr:bifunctional methylenetetrahydrofolate dehydrogenase/cyclohydrolase, mitochondrial-like [Lytechinus variegatus]